MSGLSGSPTVRAVCAAWARCQLFSKRRVPGMQKIKAAATEFLASKRVAVTGVSRQAKIAV